MSQQLFPIELLRKFDVLINSDGEHRPILAITRYYNDQYVVLHTHADDGAQVMAQLIKLDVSGNPFFVESFGHWEFEEVVS